MKKLIEIQKELKVPKNEDNEFQHFKYRTIEDILETVKPLLGDAVLLITNEAKEIAGLPYIEAKVTIKHGNEEVSSIAQAGINLVKKGMDVPQQWGTATTYARKTALQGLFLLDNSVDDPDTKDNSKEEYEEFIDKVVKISEEHIKEKEKELKKAYENGNLTKTYFKLSPEEQEHLRDFANALKGIKSEQ